MNLLLLLSALLSALTGAGGSVRQPQAPAAVSRQAAVQATRIARATSVRPTIAAPSLAAVAIGGIAQAVILVAAEPRYAMRRRK